MPVADESLKKMRKNRSVVWNHFNKIDNSTSKCMHCLRTISVTGGSIGNLLRHIKRKHPLVEIVGLERDNTGLNIKQLITMVLQKKPLWDSKDPDYDYEEVCDKLWKEISTAMEVSTEVVRYKWRDLRAKFKMEYRKSVTKSNNGKAYESKWPFYGMLTCLQSIISAELLYEDSTLVDTMIAEVVTSEDSFSNDQSPEILDFNVDNTTTYKVETCPISDVTSINNYNVPSAVRGFISPNVKQLNNTNIGQEWTVDEDVSFLNSLLPHMRKLSAIEKFRVRNDINCVMLRYLCNNNNNKTNNVSVHNNDDL